MNSRTFTMTDDQIDSIIIDELKLAYEMNYRPNKIDCSDDYLDPDNKLLTSIETVLEYFMTKNEYNRWKATRNETL